MADKVLIVEDEAFIALDLSTRLKLMGYDVLDILSTGEQFVDYPHKDKIDIALVDGRLAGPLDGYGALKKIREMNIFFPFIFMSGYNYEYLDKVKELGPVACFSKPMKLDSLLEILAMEMWKA